MAVRIDVAFRVGPSTNGIAVRYPAGSGSYVALALTEGLYATASDLAAELDRALKVANVHLVCSEWQGQFMFGTSGSRFDLQVSHVSLRLHLGLNYATYLDQSTLYGTCPLTYISAHPWVETATHLVQTRKMAISPRGVPRVVALTHWREWDVRALVRSTEMTGLRRILAALLRGGVATYARDAGVFDTWGWAQPDGRSTVTLAKDVSSYSETIDAPPATVHLSLNLTFREVTL